VARILGGFEPNSIKMPSAIWPLLAADLAQFECAAIHSSNETGIRGILRSILDAVRLGSLDSLRYSIAELVAPGSRCADPVDQLPSRIPVWQGTRAVSMLIAVEYLRVTEKRPPLNER